MPRPHTLRLACHATALVMEAAGGVLVLLNTVRLNGAELDKFRAWYYHSAVLGFILLFGGMLLAAFMLWMEHVAHARSLRASGGGTPGSAAGPAKQDIGVPGTGEYPQNISEEEAELKFERLLIDGIGALRGGQRFPKPVPVIARVLSPSDVLIKVYDLEGRVRYSHRRWGYSKLLSNPDRCKWHVLGNPIMQPKQLIFDHSAGIHKPLIQDDIVGVSFVYRLA
jgi:hypothetical protein